MVSYFMWNQAKNYICTVEEPNKMEVYFVGKGNLLPIRKERKLETAVFEQRSVPM